MALKKTPPRFVPTLTEVVRPAGVDAMPEAPPPSEDRLVERIMQRVELGFERSLREAVATLVAEQALVLRPRLHGEIEALVRKTVAEVLAEERGREPQPAGNPRRH